MIKFKITLIVYKVIYCIYTTLNILRIFTLNILYIYYLYVCVYIYTERYWEYFRIYNNDDDGGNNWNGYLFTETTTYTALNILILFSSCTIF